VVCNNVGGAKHRSRCFGIMRGHNLFFKVGHTV
jgi:hypothetical protein